MNVGIVSDHKGIILKQKLTDYLTKKGYTIVDYGTNSKESVDYPDYAFELCKNLNKNTINFGIAICGTGIGMCIACNKVKGIRCAKVSNEKEASLARLHNAANVIAISSELSLFEAKDIVDKFLTTNFSKEDRHIRRIEKINEYEVKHER